VTLALATPKSKRKVVQSFCEVNPEASEMLCYEDFKDWCCRGVTSFSMHHVPQNYEYRRMATGGNQLNPKHYQHRIQQRPMNPQDCIPTPNQRTQCLPYVMPDPNVVKSLVVKSRRQQRLESSMKQQGWNPAMLIGNHNP